MHSRTGLIWLNIFSSIVSRVFGLSESFFALESLAFSSSLVVLCSKESIFHARSLIFDEESRWNIHKKTETSIIISSLRFQLGLPSLIEFASNDDCSSRQVDLERFGLYQGVGHVPPRWQTASSVRVIVSGQTAVTQGLLFLLSGPCHGVDLNYDSDTTVKWYRERMEN